MLKFNPLLQINDGFDGKTKDEYVMIHYFLKTKTETWKAWNLLTIYIHLRCTQAAIYKKVERGQKIPKWSLLKLKLGQLARNIVKFLLF